VFLFEERKKKIFQKSKDTDGGMNKRDEIESVLKRKNIPFKIINGNYMISCPLKSHEDRNPSFGIRFDGVWNCFSCEKSGGWKDLEEVFGFRAKKVSFSEIVNGKLQQLHQQEEFQSTSLPLDFQTYNGDIPAKVLARVSEDSINKFGIGEAKRTYPGYFIIPIEIEGYKSFACRHMIRNPLHLKRWLFPRSFQKVIFPSPKKSIILTEGLIDMMAVQDFGFAASCCFGHHISDFQLAQLLSGVTEVTLLFDSYETHFLQSIKKTFKKLNGAIQVIVMKLQKDPDEVTKEEFLVSYKNRVDLSNGIDELREQKFRSDIVAKLL